MKFPYGCYKTRVNIEVKMLINKQNQLMRGVII